MSDIQWNPEDKEFNAPIKRAVAKTPKMVQWVMKTGLVKDETQANYALAGLAVIFFIITIGMFMNNGVSATTTESKSSGLVFKGSIPKEIQAKFPPGVFESLPEKFDPKKLPSDILRQLPPEIINLIQSLR